MIVDLIKLSSSGLQFLNKLGSWINFCKILQFSTKEFFEQLKSLKICCETYNDDKEGCKLADILVQKELLTEQLGIFVTEELGNEYVWDEPEKQELLTMVAGIVVEIFSWQVEILLEICKSEFISDVVVPKDSGVCTPTDWNWVFSVWVAFEKHSFKLCLPIIFWGMKLW